MPETPIIALDLEFSEELLDLAQGKLTRHQYWCASCIRQVWHLTPEEGDADLVKSAHHMTRVARLCRMIVLLEQDQLVDLSPGTRCHHCGIEITKGETVNGS